MSQVIYNEWTKGETFRSFTKAPPLHTRPCIMYIENDKDNQFQVYWLPCYRVNSHYITSRRTSSSKSQSGVLDHSVEINNFTVYYCNPLTVSKISIFLIQITYNFLNLVWLRFWFALALDCLRLLGISMYVYMCLLACLLHV